MSICSFAATLPHNVTKRKNLMPDSDLRTHKRNLRKIIRTAMRDLPPSRRCHEESLVTNHVVTHLRQQSKGTLFAYAAFSPELNIDPVIEFAIDHGWRVALPLITNITCGTMELHLITSLTDLIHSPMGIRQPSPGSTTKIDPAEIDFALVPAWAFDRLSGARLGKGAGFYDRMLATPSWRAKAYGIAFQCQLLDALPVEPHDKQVHGIFASEGLLLPV